MLLIFLSQSSLSANGTLWLPSYSLETNCTHLYPAALRCPRMVTVHASETFQSEDAILHKIKAQNISCVLLFSLRKGCTPQYQSWAATDFLQENLEFKNCLVLNRSQTKILGEKTKTKAPPPTTKKQQTKKLLQCGRDWKLFFNKWKTKFFSLSYKYMLGQSVRNRRYKVKKSSFLC